MWRTLWEENKFYPGRLSQDSSMFGLLQYLDSQQLLQCFLPWELWSLEIHCSQTPQLGRWTSHHFRWGELFEQFLFDKSEDSKGNESAQFHGLYPKRFGREKRILSVHLEPQDGIGLKRKVYDKWDATRDETERVTLKSELFLHWSNHWRWWITAANRVEENRYQRRIRDSRQTLVRRGECDDE